LDTATTPTEQTPLNALINKIAGPAFQQYAEHSDYQEKVSSENDELRQKWSASILEAVGWTAENVSPSNKSIDKPEQNLVRYIGNAVFSDEEIWEKVQRRFQYAQDRDGCALAGLAIGFLAGIIYAEGAQSSQRP
jgi:hypothetical protein